MLVRRSSMFRAAVCLGALFFPCQNSFSQDNRILVDVNQTLNRIPSTLYGTCIEDVNHEIYGGFYAQLIFGEPDDHSGLIYPPLTVFNGSIAFDIRMPEAAVSTATRHSTLNTPADTDISYTFPAHSYTILRFTSKKK